MNQLITILGLSDATNSLSVRTKKNFIKSLLSNFLSVNGFFSDFEFSNDNWVAPIKGNPKIFPREKSQFKPDQAWHARYQGLTLKAASKPWLLIHQSWAKDSNPETFPLKVGACWVVGEAFCEFFPCLCLSIFEMWCETILMPSHTGQARKTTGTTLSFGHRSNLAWRSRKVSRLWKVNKVREFPNFSRRTWSLTWSKLLWLWVIIQGSLPFLCCVSTLHLQLHHLNLDLQWGKIIQFLWAPPWQKALMSQSLPWQQSEAPSFSYCEITSSRWSGWTSAYHGYCQRTPRP